ncbi:alpha/beta hydrolase [Erwinia sp. OLTSP20]|uniref:alpha/beta fold hydrolase n=1 Tax=unclassified Erwinia TaxID=2622719 RepID=UPI000C47C3C7|nr:MULTISPECIES: alpha/beta hydrolase [unclassified Erwinia]PIJ48853.1 alpha/beta hydrolase [Erwinia sp. OAMSP11]PIJ69474.1 alpha/beta hydrolase [Erwinia sp. OLSSP12]PIJ79308.1 alpha/beta hydrolase [Erwinia sp. OLCASP19]PIJ80834.1 alpha/beta hydrolase [Erwinia sp. OLMTSP26]PIJ82986.1 alpha/beta hydrolase [Erwinia sp. OLMDSP33]
MIALLLAPLTASTASQYGAHLQGFHFPWPVQHYRLHSQGQSLSMGYLDVGPKGKANGHTAVLLHGKNFCGATWQSTINALSAAGYRVIAPDQLGFCTASKPASYQYSFQQLALNTHLLLQSLHLDKIALVGHSTGGMLATRYALMYPQQVEKLVLVNPIGLEDWKAKGVPWRSVDDWYQRELKTNAASIKKYELTTYYVGKWKPEYDRWVDMLAGLNNGPGKQAVAWNSALLYDMIFTQPVYYEFKNLRVATTLIIGTADTTAIGSDIAPPAVKATIGHYDRLGKEAARLIPGATLIEFAGMGHAPQMEDPARFNQTLLDTLNATIRR